MTSLLPLVTTLLVLGTPVRCQTFDATLTAGAGGPAIVNAVVEKIRSSCVFSGDRLFLRRIAYVESTDGYDPSTYATGAEGGIWKVNSSMFTSVSACPSVVRANCDLIFANLGIDWPSVKYTDLRKPLYSGLAAALYILLNVGGNVNAIPGDVAAQANLWKSLYHSANATGLRNYVSLAPQATTYDCEQPLDLAFILDSSSSIGNSNFSLELNFVAEVVSAMNVPSVVRIAVVIYEDNSIVEFTFHTHSSRNDVLTAIRGITRATGSTATHLALDTTRTAVFNAVNGARSNARRVAVLITDGQSNSPVQTIEAAQRLKEEAGVVLFALGVDGYNLTELRAVASQPVCTHVYTLPEYQRFSDIITEIQKSACEAPTVINKEQNVTLTLGTNETEDTFFAWANGGVLGFQVNCGVLSIYISYTNPKPSSAFYDEKYLATPGHPAYVPTRSASTGHPVYVTVVGKRSLPSSESPCTDYRYFVFESEKNFQIKCCQDSNCRDCTPEEFRREGTIQEVACTNYDRQVSNPCTPAALEVGHLLFPYPYDPNSFIRCDYSGNYYITLCPNGEPFNLATLTCGYGSSQSIPLPFSYPNPCTANEIQNLHLFFEYLPDPQLFIHCDLTGHAWLQSCPALEVWDQGKQTCVDDRPHLTGPVINIVNPCTAAAIAANLFFHPYPCDHTRFIHCDITPLKYAIMSCSAGMFFDPKISNCLPTDEQPRSAECP